MKSVIDAINESRQKLGSEKLKLGAYLCLAQESESWRDHSHAKTFRGWIKEIGMEPNSSFQYMKVAQKYINELQISEKQIEQLSLVGMSVLEKSLNIVTEENLQEVINIVTSMPRAEALEELESMQEGLQSKIELKTSREALRVLRAIEDLSHSSKIEVLNSINQKKLNYSKYNGI